LVIQRLLSPLLPPSCRFVPTCSQYGFEAIAHFGMLKGGWLAVKRILRCQPFNPVATTGSIRLTQA